MDWHLTNIPKIMFGFWGTEDFPFIRWATLKTFRKFHPDWDIILYKKPVLDKINQQVSPEIAKALDKFNGYEDLAKASYDPNYPNYWCRLEELDIKVIDIDVEKEMGTNFPRPYITCFADVMRYIVFTKFHGGHYVDLDNLYFKSMESAPFNIPENAKYASIILPPPYHHWLLATYNAPWCNKVLKNQLANLPQTNDKFLDTTAITEKIAKSPEDRNLIIPLATTEENFNANGPTNGHAVCLNWHGSGVYGKYNMVTEENYKTSDHPLAACVRYCIDGSIGKANGIGTFQWIARGG